MTSGISHPTFDLFFTFIALKGRQLSLARQFAIAGSVVLLAGMVAIGVWVTKQIEDGVTRNTGTSTALYVDSFVAPLVQELVQRDTLSSQARAELDGLVEKAGFGKRIVSIKIWKPGGLIAYASRASIIGKVFPSTPNRERAWAGEVTAELDTLIDEEDALERAAGLVLLEIYSPLRENRTGRIIAVAEFYETAAALKQHLFWTKLQSWLVVAAVTLCMLGLLFGIVLRGSRTIEKQRHALEQRVSDLSRLLAQNEELRNRVQRASRRTTEMNERYLRRLSADIHDGPAQLLAVASLRLDALKPLVTNVAESTSGERSDLEIVRESVTGALSELRDVCAGLILPELDDLGPVAILRNVAQAHERRTGTIVGLAIDSVPDDLPKSMKICVYRFVEEALNNAYHHAGGEGQGVTCRCDGQALEVEVSDTGPGFDSSQKTETRRGLGLPGLRERIESLGGTLEISSAPGKGTRLVLRCRVKPERETYAGQYQDRAG
jgi:signal transduction histidine kinase